MCENPRRETARERKKRETILLQMLPDNDFIHRRQTFEDPLWKNASLVQIKGANVPFIAAREVGNNVDDGHK